jgi:glycosyltransferase involved in cell wall biosynthesis
MDIKVSVIIPCYNQGRYIDEAIKSVLASSYDDLEIIVVNDGSNDSNTNELLATSKWDKTSIYKIDNGGVSGARNYGIGKAAGKYILPLDADDKISSEYIRNAVEILNEKPEVKIVACDVEMFGIRSGKYPMPEHSIEMLLCQNTMVVSSMFRKSDFDKTKGFSSNMSSGFEDWDFWLTMLETGGSVYKLNFPGFYYRIQHKSRNNSITDEQFAALRRKIYDNHKELYSKHFFNPVNSFEYALIRNSKEYIVGKSLLKPLRYFFNLLK